MNRLSIGLASALIGASLAGAPPTLAMDGELFGGLDMGVSIPTNALDRAADEGGNIAPFLGYMLFKPEDRRLNLGIMGQAGFLGLSRDRTTNHPNRGVVVNKNTWAFTTGIGPRVALPIDKFELNGRALIGLITGLNTGPIRGTDWGFTVGGGVDYRATDCLKVGVFADYNRFYQDIHDIGDIRYINTGIRLTAVPAPAAAPAPPPPPPPPPAEPEVVVPEPTQRITLRGVNFDFDKATIREDARPILDEAIRILAEKGTVDIVAEGHTDATGPEGYNQTLSEGRANAVRDYLVKGGVDASRISVRGYGESQPVADNGTRDGRAQNRRVELRVAK